MENDQLIKTDMICSFVQKNGMLIFMICREQKKTVKSWKGEVSSLMHVRNYVCGLCSVPHDHG